MPYDVDVVRRYLEEYSSALGEQHEEDAPPVAPLKTVRIPGYIRKASALEANAGAWVLRLGSPDPSD